jgi:hypothetical protein
MKLESANLHQHSVTNNMPKSWIFNDTSLKNSIGYTTAIVSVFAAIGFLFANLPVRFADNGGKYFFVLLYGLTGIAHVFTFPKWLPQLHEIKGFIYTLLLSAVISAAIFFVFNNIPFNVGLFPFAAAAAFVLPLAVTICWQLFSAIPVQQSKPWYMPGEMQPETRMSLLLNSLFFQIAMKAAANDAEVTEFSVTLPARLTTGEMFCRFLHDQQGRVEATGKNQQPYGWQFYVKTWWGKRPINATTSLTGNNVKEGDTIIIERI